MGKNIWCTVNPGMTKQIASKYNISKKDARTLYNKARENDRSLIDDNITLEMLEQSTAFQDALKDYTEKFVTIPSFLTKSPGYGTKETPTLADEIREELGITMSEEEVQARIESMIEAGDTTKFNNITTDKLAKIFTAFKDTSRMNFIGQWMTSFFIDKVTTFDTSEEARNNYDIKQQSVRTKYFTDKDISSKIKSDIYNIIMNRAAALRESGNNELAIELETAAEYMDTFLYMYGGNFYDEGIKVNRNGVFTSKSEHPTKEEQAEFDDENEENNDDEGELPVNAFSASDQNNTVFSKIIPSIRQLLSTIRDVNDEGYEKLDPYGYHLWNYIPVRELVNKILDWTAGQDRYDGIINALKKNLPGNPWIQQLLNALDDKAKTNTTNGDAVDSRKEQLRSMFYQSARKQHTVFRMTYQTYDTYGNPVSISRDANVKHLYNTLHTRLRRKFKKRKGMSIYKDGKLVFSEIYKLDAALKTLSTTGELFADKMLEAKSAAVNLASVGKEKNEKQNFAQAYRALDGAKTAIINVLKNLGIDIKKSELNDFLNNNPEAEFKDEGFWNGNDKFGDEIFQTNYTRLIRLRELCSNIISEYRNWETFINSNKIRGNQIKDSVSTDPLSRSKDASDYPNFKKIRWAYDLMFKQLSKYAADTYEQNVRIDSKNFYAMNNPSTVQTIVEKLSNMNMDERRAYIMKTYGKDKVWFLRPDSTPEEPHFYSDLLERLYYGEDEGVLQYSEKPSVYGTTYDAVSDRQYNMAILNDFFQGADGRDDWAWYRMFISSDKPRYSSLRDKKYTRESQYKLGDTVIEEDYKTEITNRAIPFLAQEMRRAIDVINTGLREGVTRIDGYDVKPDKKDIKEVLDKIKSGKNITVNDVVKNGKYIFRNTGASFFFNKFINDSIEKKTKLGEYIVDHLFNSAKYEGKKLLTSNAIKLFKEEFASYMKDMRDEYYTYLQGTGMFRIRFRKTTEELDNGEIEEYYLPHAEFIVGELQNWHAGDPGFNMYMPESEEDLKEFARSRGIDIESTSENRALACELYQFYNDLEVFTYNSWLARANSMEVINVDPAFYKNTVNAQKRAAQQISAGFVTDPDAKIHGKPVSDGKYRSITIKTTKITSDEIAHIETALRSALAKIKNASARKAMEISIEDTLDKLRKMDTTDGQALVGPSSLRKRLAGQGEWSRSITEQIDEDGFYTENGKTIYVYTDEAVYRRMKRGYKTAIDKGAQLYDFQHVFAQPRKDFVYSFVSTEREGRGTITTPVQHKNSEAALIFLSAFIEGSNLDTKMQGIARFLEYTVENNDNNDSRMGIDTVNWDSAVKIGGNNRTIDLSECKTGQEVFEALKKAVYEEGTTNYKKDGTVTEYDNTDYKIIQQNPEHFKDNSQPLGSQIKVHSISNISDNDMFTLSDGSQIDGYTLKKRYFKALQDKTVASENRFKDDIGLNLPYNKRIQKLSETFRRLMQSDERFTAEMRRTLGITERDGVNQFVLPLDDPAQKLAIEASLMSMLRKAYYRTHTNGGIVVQATSWDSSEDLHIRFKSKNAEDIANNDGLLMTLEEYKNKYSKKIKQEKWSEEKVKAEYETYRKENQGDYSHFEFECPMPDYIRKMIADKNGNIDAKYFNEDGSWNMEEIKKIVPESAFEAICYRIPTEAKYSIMVCKIKRFSREGSGSVARYPAEITTFTGSDFDIDKDFIELRPIKGSSTEDADNEIFEMQMAVLRSSKGQLETFRSGDFSDVSEFSYYVHLLENGYGRETLDGMSADELKTLCEQTEDLDMMSPRTDSILRRQNMESKDMIAVAAVGTVSHSFMSIYNEQDSSGMAASENNIRISLKEGTAQTESECFTVINDKPGVNTRLEFKGDVVLDPTYDMDGNLISAEIGKYVGASADAAKDAALYRLNITMETLPVLQYMHRIGVSSDVARAFIASPAIRSITEALNGGSNFGYNTISGICKDIMSMLPYMYEGVSDEKVEAIYNSISHSDTNTLQYSKLIAAIENNETLSLEDYLTHLYLYQKFSHEADLLRNFDAFARYNSTNAMRGSSFLDRYAKRQSILKLMKTLNAEEPRFKLPQNIDITEGFDDSEYGRMCSMFPYIASIIHGEEQMLDQVIIENMHTYSNTFFRAVRELEIDDDADAMKTLYAGWVNYLLFVSGNRIVDFWNPATVRYYTRDFAEHFFSTLEDIEISDPDFYANVIENNTFIDSISPIRSKPGYVEFELLSADTMGRKGPDLERYQRDWEKLLNYPQTRKLATDTAIYFLARSAAFSSDTPVTVMPSRVKEAIPNYIKAFTDADKISMSDDEFYRFITMFMRNNADNKTLVPTLYNTKDRYVIDFDENKGVIKLNAQYIDRYAGYLKGSAKEGLYLKMPVMSIDRGGQPNLYVVANTNPLKEVKDGNEVWYTIEAMPAAQLGIKNQMVEYTGLDTTSSIFDKMEDGAGNVIYAEDVADSPLLEDTNMKVANITSDFYAGRKVGTFIKSSPFGDNTDYLYMPTTSLSKNEEDFKGNPYLESRIHLKRSRKILDYLDVKLGKISRISTSTGPAYMFNIVPGPDMTANTEKIKEAAALISSLGYETDSSPRIKTYVSDPMSQDYNGIEVSVKIGKDEKTRKILLGMLKESQNWHYELDGNSNELLLTYATEFSDDAQKLLTNVRRLLGATQALIQKVREAGGEIESTGEFNYVQTSTVDKTEQLTKLKQYAEESERLTSGSKRQAGANAGERAMAKTGNEVGLNDIVTLALRREKGEKVTDEIRSLFGETKLPLRSTDKSLASSIVASSTLEALQAHPTLFAELVQVSRSINAPVSEQELVSNIIVNTANWIMGNRPKEVYDELATNIGMSKQSAEGILETIKSVLDKLNIC